MMRRSRGPEVKADPVFSLPSLYLSILNLMTNYSDPKRKIPFNLRYSLQFKLLCAEKTRDTTKKHDPEEKFAAHYLLSYQK